MRFGAKRLRLFSGKSGEFVSLQAMRGLSGDDPGVIAGVDFFLLPGFLREKPGGQQRQGLMTMTTP